MRDAETLLTPPGARRILQVVHSPEPGGVLTLARLVADGLSRHGMMVETVYLYGDTASGKIERLLGSLRLAGRILRGGHDGLIAYQATASIVVGSIGWLRRIPTRIVHQTTQPSETAAPIRWLDRVVGQLGLYPVNVVNSGWTRTQFNGYPPKYRRALRLIEHGISVPVPSHARAETLQAHGIPDDGPILLNTGRLVEQKNQGVLIRALPMLPGVRLVIAGGGHMLEEYRALAAQLGVADRLHLLGALPHAVTPNLYAAADLFVFPSLNETFGISVVEAALLARPAVVADIEVLREVLTIEGSTEAVFVGPHDVPGWAAAIRTMLKTPPSDERLALFARRIADRFSEQAMVDAYIALIVGEGVGG